MPVIHGRFTFHNTPRQSDLDLIRETKQHYAESKLLAEREAWRILEVCRDGLCCPPSSWSTLQRPLHRTRAPRDADSLW